MNYLMRMNSLLRLLLAAILLAPAISSAEGWNKDPEQLAAEAKKMAAQLKSHADELEAKAISEGKSLTGDIKKYVALTRDEALNAEKAAAAWTKNQKRLAEKYAEKVSELCRERGPLAEKVFAGSDKKCEDTDKGKCDPAAKEDSAKADKYEKPAKSDKAAELAEIERKQAELDAKKKALLTEE